MKHKATTKAQEKHPKAEMGHSQAYLLSTKHDIEHRKSDMWTKDQIHTQEERSLGEIPAIPSFGEHLWEWIRRLPADALVELAPRGALEIPARDVFLNPAKAKATQRRLLKMAGPLKNILKGKPRGKQPFFVVFRFQKHPIGV